ncbi:hypothetical protein E2C01_060632 [Portunus trituberculatus]|uniref:Uncharacterized protein n=1 Tax=Portunus trituberculatus TaxID=210409 RepID=A0A5B7HCM6_PORTR|nr:hypothetical protein [Portunus trituberculatus]
MCGPKISIYCTRGDVPGTKEAPERRQYTAQVQASLSGCVLFMHRRTSVSYGYLQVALRAKYLTLRGFLGTEDTPEGVLTCQGVG